MLMKRLLVSAVAVILPDLVFAANFVQGGGPADITIVNLTTGTVTICPTDAEAIGVGAALPACVNVGTLNVSGVSGNAADIAINPAPASMGGEVITNLTNGAYLQCNVEVSGNNGGWLGKCVAGVAY